ncbi:GLPGLI family protein [Chryseobacterium taiwanense]|uniref:GLPGLI family protein n=1 Tax=Chryseobacterium taiwanense TaxID=363331 RepID=UPI00068AF5C8|nr:GLPGLI family protein [Chryseobacterium taiwanense]
MRTNILIILLITISSIFQAQIIKHFQPVAKIEYNMILTLNGYQKYKAELYYNDATSYYTYKLANNEETKVLADQSDEKHNSNTKVELSVNSSFDFILMDEENKKIRSSVWDFKNKKIHYIEEDQTKIDWKLLDETKLIGDFLCKKATGKFKGRDYIAWYSPQISTSFGPMKFGQLPGLIFEISDTQNKFFCQISKITIPYTTILDINLDTTPISKAEYTVSLKSYMQELNDNIKKKMENTIAKMSGDDIKVSNIKIETNDNKVEQLEIEDVP